MQLHVVTYNIHKGFSPGRVKFMLPQVREALAEIESDLVFLQEVQGEHKSREPQLEYLADSLWPHTAYAKNAIYQAGHHGNAILSKYPIDSCANINLTKLIRASRSLLHGVIKLPETDKNCHVLCVHLGLLKNAREVQTQTLIERIQSTVKPDEPLIIAGDCNDWRKKTSDLLEDILGLKEVFKETHGDYAKSYPAWSPQFCNDRIYYRGLELIEGRCLSGKAWRVLSDHLPLYSCFGL